MTEPYYLPPITYHVKLRERIRKQQHQRDNQTVDGE